MQGPLKTGEGRRQASHPPNCVECGWKLSSIKGSMRPPGTKSHYGHGLCSTCWERRRRKKSIGLVTVEPISPEVVIAHHAAALAAWIRGKRRRIGWADTTLWDIDNLKELRALP
ncbi:hypothetical protein SPF06_00895 [Sinomonas sp. JGH33]|uniref:Uncharacterized protein n=1 Tax=Sinomonas terricola TaxID=3110330 RepID=A0ABU5T163_9MICC|nr:hypothetical protein [Sinomonas sp. JGH33]MEA5453267.1 hypothetical protein [Sinomonas sp. JGH33]